MMRALMNLIPQADQHPGAALGGFRAGLGEPAGDCRHARLERGRSSRAAPRAPSPAKILKRRNDNFALLFAGTRNATLGFQYRRKALALMARRNEALLHQAPALLTPGKAPAGPAA